MKMSGEIRDKIYKKKDKKTHFSFINNKKKNFFLFCFFFVFVFVFCVSFVILINYFVCKPVML